MVESVHFTFNETIVGLFCLCCFYVIMSTTYESETFIKTDRTILHCVSDRDEYMSLLRLTYLIVHYTHLLRQMAHKLGTAKFDSAFLRPFDETLV